MSTYITPTIVAKEALMVLENNTVMAGLVHRDYSKEYQKIGSTVVIRKPTSMTASAVSGGTATHMNTVTESSVTVILDNHFDVSWEVNSQEMSLQIKDFSEQFIQPAMRGMADTVDNFILSQYGTIAGHYMVSSAAAVLGDIAQLGAVMTTQQVPLEGRRLVLHPITGASYLSVQAFHEAHKRADGGRALRNAEIGHVMGFDTYIDQNVPKHAQPVGDNALALVDALVTGSTSATVSGITAAGTILHNDVFKLTGIDQWFRVNQASGTALVADSGGSALIADFQPPLVGAAAATTVLTIQKTHRANLAFHKNFLAFVTAPLAPPLSGVNAAVVNYRGLSCRVVFDYLSLSKTNFISIDMLCGVKVLDQKLAARLCDTELVG